MPKVTSAEAISRICSNLRPDRSEIESNEVRASERESARSIANWRTRSASPVSGYTPFTQLWLAKGELVEVSAVVFKNVEESVKRVIGSRKLISSDEVEVVRGSVILG